MVLRYLGLDRPFHPLVAGHEDASMIYGTTAEYNKRTARTRTARKHGDCEGAMRVEEMHGLAWP